MAYYGPGSTGSQNPYQQPIQHGISNPPFFHTNKQLDTETGSGWGKRITQEYHKRGGQALPDAWDVTNPGGPGVGGTGAFAPPSPFLFPGQLPSQGVRLANGQVVNGSVGSDGQISGSLSGGGAQQQFSGYAGTGSPTQGVIGQVNTGAAGAGGAGGSINIGQGFGNIPSNPTQQQADGILNQQRDMAVDRLHDVDRLFQSRLADLTTQSLERQVQGTDVPFDDRIMNLMEARLADQATAADRGRRSMIRDQFAGRGLAGSGMQRGAEQASLSEASAQRGNNLGNLLVQQATENFGARERGRAGAQAWLSQQASGILPGILEEARMRSRFEVTGDAGSTDAGNALTAMALNQLQGPDPASNPAAFNTTLPFGPGATGNISTPGGPPIRATGGVQGGFTPGTMITQAGQGGGLNGSQVISSLFGNGAQQAGQASNFNPQNVPSPLALPQQQQGPVPLAPQQNDPFAWLNQPGLAQTGPSFMPLGIGGRAL